MSLKIPCLHLQRIYVQISDEDVARLRHRLGPVSRIRTAAMSEFISLPVGSLK